MVIECRGEQNLQIDLKKQPASLAPACSFENDGRWTAKFILHKYNPNNWISCTFIYLPQPIILWAQLQKEAPLVIRAQLYSFPNAEYVGK